MCSTRILHIFFLDTWKQNRSTCIILRLYQHILITFVLNMCYLTQTTFQLLRMKIRVSLLCWCYFIRVTYKLRGIHQLLTETLNKGAVMSGFELFFIVRLFIFRNKTDLGSCVTTAAWRCRKNLSQWERSFVWKLRCVWVKWINSVRSLKQNSVS